MIVYVVSNSVNFGGEHDSPDAIMVGVHCITL